MATQQEKIVRIEHADGRRAAVSEHTFSHKKMVGLGDKTYQDAGFEIIGYEDGTPYGTDEQPSEYAISKTAKAPEIGAVAEPKPASKAAKADPAPKQDAQAAPAAGE